jgi:hypothetical protein
MSYSMQKPMGRLLPAAVAAVFVASLVPAGALAQSSSGPTADKPPGVVYQLPLENGRADAAPRSQDSGAPNDDSSSKDGSLYRSENNFGSSSQVPGAKESSGNPDDAKGLAASRTGLAEADSSASDDPGGGSFFESPWLLALIAAAGAGLAVVGIRAWRSGQRP